MSESIRAFLLDSIAQNNNSLENLEVYKEKEKIFEKAKDLNLTLLIQIEAKFGLIIDNGTSQRIQLPVYSECGRRRLKSRKYF